MTLTPQEKQEILRRQNAALQKMDAGHEELLQSLDGMETEEAFLASRWSVREVLLHLDSERYIDALEQIARGERQMLPPFTSREEHFRQELAHQEATHQRLRNLLAGLTPEQLSQPATPPNPENAFPGLTLLELLERSAGHEASHARQIRLTREYIAAFRTRQGILNIVALGNGDPDQTLPSVKNLLNMADYLIGDPEALDVVAPYARGALLTLTPENRHELINRAAREAREGLWPIICVMGFAPDPETLTLAKQHANAITIHHPHPP